MKRLIYKWHRKLSIIVVVPVLLWAISGFMHPIMTNIRPGIATQALALRAIDSNKIKISLKDALLSNRIDTINNTITGKVLFNGDELYAIYLAKYFLNGGKCKENKGNEATGNSTDDCCSNLSAALRNSEDGISVKSVNRVTNFDGEYKYINRLLPAYKVAFKRADGIRIYVDTEQSRFSLAVDNKRAVFNTFFGLFHTWDWLNFLGKGKELVILFFSLLAFIIAVMGIVIFFFTKTKKSNGNSYMRTKWLHRITAISASLFTLLFSFSGAYHAYSKWSEKEHNTQAFHKNYASAAINLEIKDLLKAAPSGGFYNIGITTIHDQVYWQLYLSSKEAQSKKKKDLMKSMSVSGTSIAYVSAADYTTLKNGDELYATALAKKFNTKDSVGNPGTLVTKFTDEYNFADKRLPVWKISFNGSDNKRLYIETQTGVLAKAVADGELYEGYSFALFHKHHFMDFAGKSWRDASTMFWAFIQVVMVVIGLSLWIKRSRKKA